jgi:hypothetical protein
MKGPGWDGLAIRMRCSLVIVLEVEINDLIVLFVDAKCNPPITGHREAPRQAVACQATRYGVNIQVIDGALNCTFSLFQATDEEFALILPASGQDIQYAEDLSSLPDVDVVLAALSRVWQRPIRKRDAVGIHGTLFYELGRYKKVFRRKREGSVDPSAINDAQRRMPGL